MERDVGKVLTGIHILENGEMEKLMVKVLMSGLMEISTKVTGLIS